MDKERAVYLYEQYSKDDLSAEERPEWESLGLDLDNDRVFQDLVDGFWEYKNDGVPSMKAERVLAVEEYILAQDQSELRGQSQLQGHGALQGQGERRKVGVLRFWPRIAIAAAVAVMIASVGIWFYVSNDANKAGGQLMAYQNDIAPGKVGATLTLASGKTIRLGDAANGEIANEAGIRVKKTEDGQVIYEMIGAEGHNGAEQNGGTGENVGIGNRTGVNGAVNTLTTAKGETYVLILPDKSKVWMNASSSLTYSASLKGLEKRKVNLEGEAYFEVSKDKARPFLVESRNQVVEVLGTHFNVSSYANERAVKTTLLEGSVRVSQLDADRGGKGARIGSSDGVMNPDPQLTTHNSRLLSPGQQSTVEGAHAIQVAEVNADDVLDWKSGDFNFNGEGVQSIMRRLSRWYDIEVVYEGKISGEAYYGKVSRNKNISTILKVLEKSEGVHFKIEGRRVTVLE